MLIELEHVPEELPVPTDASHEKPKFARYGLATQCSPPRIQRLTFMIMSRHDPTQKKAEGPSKHFQERIPRQEKVAPDCKHKDARGFRTQAMEQVR